MSSEGQQSAEWFRATWGAVRSEIQKVVVGQDEVVEGVLACLVANGHALLEGMPGLGKTLLVRTLGDVLDLGFSRIQFTPDMMPADVTGTSILTGSEGARTFEFRPGPIFANLILADEINRATPKTQSAMLEAMQERQVTAAGERRPLSEPFLVMATQNPIEQEGTYPLPEAQLDRFFYKILVPYPKRHELAQIVQSTTGTTHAVATSVATGADVLKAREIVRGIEVAQDVLNFALSIIVATHAGEPTTAPITKRYVRYGSSPRGAQTLVTAAKVYALLDGRFHVSRDDLKKAAKPTLRHRLLLNFEAEADAISTDHVIDEVIAHVDAADRDPVKV